MNCAWQAYLNLLPHWLRNEVDKQGRILLPGVLREFADITKDAVLIGVGRRIEIWSKDRWEGTVTYQDMEDISRHMIELGIGI